MKENAGSGAIYGMGVIGAAIYYIQNAPNATALIIGIVKALFWPAVILYKALEILKM